MTAGATPELIIHRDARLLAQAMAARLVTKLVDVLAAKDEAHLVLTGGSVGIGSLAAVAELPARVAVDWKRVHLWWSDERFLPEGDPERNVTQARGALLDKLDLDPAFVHEMPSTNGPDGDNAEADVVVPSLGLKPLPEGRPGGPAVVGPGAATA